MSCGRREATLRSPIHESFIVFMSLVVMSAAYVAENELSVLCITLVVQVKLLLKSAS